MCRKKIWVYYIYFRVCWVTFMIAVADRSSNILQTASGDGSKLKPPARIKEMNFNFFFYTCVQNDLTQCPEVLLVLICAVLSDWVFMLNTGCSVKFLLTFGFSDILTRHWRSSSGVISLNDGCAAFRCPSVSWQCVREPACTATGLWNWSSYQEDFMDLCAFPVVKC